jgi:hypothetical protein
MRSCGSRRACRSTRAAAPALVRVPIGHAALLLTRSLKMRSALASIRSPNSDVHGSDAEPAGGQSHLFDTSGSKAGGSRFKDWQYPANLAPAVRGEAFSRHPGALEAKVSRQPSDKHDEALEDSFPASDPPAASGIVGPKSVPPRPGQAPHERNDDTRPKAHLRTIATPQRRRSNGRIISRSGGYDSQNQRLLRRSPATWARPGLLQEPLGLHAASLDLRCRLRCSWPHRGAPPTEG